MIKLLLLLFKKLCYFFPPGLAIMVLYFIIKSFAARKQAQYDKGQKEHADQRMKIVSQVFSGIKVTIAGLQKSCLGVVLSVAEGMKMLSDLALTDPLLTSQVNHSLSKSCPTFLL